jgi:hypothetical protein
MENGNYTEDFANPDGEIILDDMTYAFVLACLFVLNIYTLIAEVRQMFNIGSKYV